MAAPILGSESGTKNEPAKIEILLTSENSSLRFDRQQAANGDTQTKT